MSKNNQLVNSRMSVISALSKQVRAACLESQFGQGGFIADDSQRLAAIDAAARTSPLFESLGDQAGGVASAWGSALKEYYESFGRLPSEELLASAAQALRNITFADSEGGSTAMLESVKASLSTSEGIEIRAKQAGLILPVLLMAATSDAVTYIPAQANETEIFEIRRVAGSNFGDYKQGDEIGLFSHGQYSSMNQTYMFGATEQPDGNKTAFVYDSSKDGFAGKVPFKKGTVKVLVNRRLCATEVAGQEGKLFGSVVVGNATITITGTITPLSGIVNMTTSAALPKGATLVLEYDVDIEKAAELIPTVSHDMQSWTLRPHESVIAAEYSIQSYWLLNREFSIDIRSMQMNHLRNYLAYEKDIKNLRKMILVATDRVTFDLKVPTGQYYKEHYELLATTLQVLSQDMMTRTKVSGLVGLYCGASACAAIKSLGSPHFEFAPGYKQVPRVHFVGTLFGMFKVFEVPKPIEAVKGLADATLGEWDCLCYARGDNHTEAGLVCGDAVPATMYGHGVKADLSDRNTLWELSYCDVHPNDGGRYYSILTLIPPTAEAGA